MVSFSLFLFKSKFEDNLNLESFNSSNCCFVTCFLMSCSSKKTALSQCLLYSVTAQLFNLLWLGVIERFNHHACSAFFCAMHEEKMNNENIPISGTVIIFFILVIMFLPVYMPMRTSSSIRFTYNSCP